MFETAPQIFKQCTSSGVPYISLGFTSLFSLLAYMNASSSTATVFSWFVNLINGDAYLSWVCICIIYILFRKATLAQKVTELPYRSIFQPYVAYIDGSIHFLLLLLNGFTVFFPGHWESSTFIPSCIGIPIFVVIFLVHKLYSERHEPWFIVSKKVDLSTGLSEIVEMEVVSLSGKGKWYKKLKALFE